MAACPEKSCRRPDLDFSLTGAAEQGEKQMKKYFRQFLSFLLAIVLLGSSLYPSTMAKADSYPYLISVNKQMNTVTIYGKDDKGEYKVPVKAFICSTGYATPLGDFKIQIQYRWKELINGCWGQYSSRVTWDGIIIHSVWYYGPYAERQNGDKFNALGTTNSNGCINMTVQDCKWVYNNCPVGTPIHIYNSDNPGPLGKPEMLKVPHSIGYDPTDRWTPGNPYNEKKPIIKGVKNHKVKYGESYNVMDGISASNTTGYDATKLVTVEIKTNGKKIKKINSKKPGIYNVTYKITDQIGRKDKKTAVVTVVDNVKPEIKRVKDHTVPYGTKLNRETLMKNVRAKWHKVDLTDDVRVTVEKKRDGYYKVTYTVEAPNGKKAKAVCHYTVEDTLRFEGVGDRVLSEDSVVTTDSVLEGIKAFSGGNELPTSSVIVDISERPEEEEYNVYKVTYTIENKDSVLSEKAYFRVKKKKEDSQVTSGSSINSQEG